MMDGWSLAAPLALSLLPLPLLAQWLLPRQETQSGALMVPLSIASRFDPDSRSVLGAAQRAFLPIILWTALVFAIAGPQRIVPTKALPVSGRDIILALDFSGSMARKDVHFAGQPESRLDAVKRMAARFVRGRPGDRLGLVIFATEAFFAAPPTYDLEAVAQAIEIATIGISGRSTAISDGLGLALKRLEKSSAPSRVIILLSDGVNNAGTVLPKDAADLAQRLGIRVHTIAFGPRDMEGGTNEIDVVDAKTLQEVAEASGGRAFRVRTNEELDAVGHAIDELETNEADAPPMVIYQSYWTYPAVLALLVALVILSGNRRWA
jgi:Ca-activated chloride channel family protein